jgi:hypothetical protein
MSGKGLFNTKSVPAKTQMTTFEHISKIIVARRSQVGEDWRMLACLYYVEDNTCPNNGG